MNAWEIVQNVSAFFWDWPLPILLLAVGVFTAIGFRGKQTFSIRTLFQNSLGTAFRKNDGGRGSITSFASAMTSLGNCVGTGNIGGVASAIAIGGPGAVFWMWLSGILGMSTKAAEIIIGQRYRVKFSKSRDEYMCNRDFVLDHALGWRKLAIFSAVSVLITQPINGLVQTNAVSSSIEEAFGVPQQITVWIVVVLLTITVLGGLKRISHIAETLVPFMCVVYIVAVVILLVLNWRNIPMAFASIFKYAFTPMSAVGGFVGASVQQAFRYGIARGLFSNDSGVGAALCAHAPAKTDHPARQACWGWGENFVDTLIVCTCTALAILCTDIYILRPDITGVQLSTAAFGQTFGWTGSSFLSITVSLFAWTTLLGTYYQTEKSLNYLIGDKNIKWVTYIWMASYILLQFLGSMDATLLWVLADISGVIKVLITLTLIVMLREEIFRLNTDFFDRYLPALKRGENPAPVIYGDYDSAETAGDGQSTIS